MSLVMIRGDGVAARCCAHLLRKAGLAIAVERPSRGRVPAIMLSEHAIALIRDVFDQPELFEKFPRIRRRVVAWGMEAKPVELENLSIVVSEEALLNGVLPDYEESVCAGTPEWTIHASPNHPTHDFGTRRATAAGVKLKPDALPETCWIESLESGWLFLITDSPGSGWLLSVGADPDRLLAESRLIRKQIAELAPGTREFPAFPRIASPLTGEGWIGCGTAAMAFDPICGDGTAHAVREAILAAAVIKAAVRGEDATALRAHYEDRLVAAFQRHVGLCLQYYKSGQNSVWWQTEAGHLERGLAWCADQLAGRTGFRYRLENFDLYRAD